MLKSDALRNLRSGPIIEAAGLFDGTVRAWARNNDLQLGNRASLKSGNPRYELVDAARLVLMSWLTDQLQLKAQAAAATINAAAPYLHTLAEIELDAIDHPGSAPQSERWILQALRLDGETNPEIKSFSELQAEECGRGLIAEVRLDLRESVRYARDRLCAILGVSREGISHTFADLPQIPQNT